MSDYISRAAACEQLRLFLASDDEPRSEADDWIDFAIAAIARLVPAADVVEVVRCGECIHAPLPGDGEGSEIKWPEHDDVWLDETCPYCCSDRWYSIRPNPDWFCNKGERRTE